MPEHFYQIPSVLPLAILTVVPTVASRLVLGAFLVSERALLW